MGIISRKDYLNKYINSDLDFEMPTPEGNDKAKEIVLEALNKMFYEDDFTRRKIISLLNHRISNAYSDKSTKYKDIKDTEPKECITEQINKAVLETGYGYKISRFDLI